MLEFTYVLRRPCHECHRNRIFTFTAFSINCTVASAKVGVNSLGLSSASQEQSCSCSALPWPHPHSENGLREGWEQLGGRLTDKLAGWGKAGWGQLLLRCLGFTSAGHSSAEQPEEVGGQLRWARTEMSSLMEDRLWDYLASALGFETPPLPRIWSRWTGSWILCLQSHSYQWKKQSIEQMFSESIDLWLSESCCANQ